MTKRKTALASAIEEIQAMPNYSTGIEYRLRNKIIEILKSKLPKEKQDLINAYQQGAMDYPVNHENYFNNTFENEN